MTALTRDVAEARLVGVRSMLAADGYELTVEVGSDTVMLGVVAGESACEDCLVPKDLMVDIIRDSLGEGTGAPYPGPVSVRYPGEAGVGGAT